MRALELDRTPAFDADAGGTPIYLHPGRTTRALLIALAVLVALHVAVQTLRLGFGHDRLWGLRQLFSIDDEANLPTYFSAALFTFSAALLAVIGIHSHRIGDRFTRHWFGLCLLTLWMGADDVATMHEIFGAWLRHTIGTPGGLYFVWILPAIAFVALLGFAYVRFLGSLGAAHRRRLLVAGALFFGGAIGIESVTGFYWGLSGPGQYGLFYTVVAGIEETLELVGVIALIHALLVYMDAEHIAPRFSFGTAGPP